MAGFRKFLVRSNLVDLSVAVVVGVAFSNVVQALIKDLITPLIAALGGKPNFSNLVFSINKSHFRYGDFINVALYFLIIAAVIYYFVVVPANRLTTIATRNTEAAEHPCPECLSNIPAAASRCRFCTAIVEPYLNGHRAHPATTAVVTGNRTGVGPNTSCPASAAAEPTASATAPAMPSGQCTITSSCWKKTRRAAGAASRGRPAAWAGGPAPVSFGAEVAARRRRSPASRTIAQSAALACTTKLRVNRPRARSDRPACASSASGSSATAVSPRHASEGGGQVRPSRDLTTRPSSPARAAASTYCAASGNRRRSTASSWPASPPAPPYMADSNATLALPRSPPNAPASASYRSPVPAAAASARSPARAASTRGSSCAASDDQDMARV